ncbi:hypothetical protein B0H16DRAFT_1727604 [Mycena metata]|uniref:Transmembrane protein n=1 Tax=Mycena metata TaxID=1033252 RepID=A0AAD7DRI5_9AGAR|nr:hypothetical protein B0H16DRAFT_1484966 [Mycena metata]KAJ7696631.1 hypothetical protein B0H16DRAFT_1484969 [Mycena metata]KAJ7743556.1 hypothetical protein B0H16DRAFT_1727604 [Mycena metata]
MDKTSRNIPPPCWHRSSGVLPGDKQLVLKDVDDRILLTGTPEYQVQFVANYLDVDATARTAIVDWFPVAVDCSAPELVVNFFVDPNLLDDGGAEEFTSTAPPVVPIFRFNTTEGCFPTNLRSFPVFRTVFKLTGLGVTGELSLRTGTLQAYPYDKYYFQISMFAQTAAGESVGLLLDQSFGIPINFDVIINKAHSTNNEEGLSLEFSITRSRAVIGLVIIIVVANWLVTIAFLWITVAAFVWDQEIVADMFVLPIGTLFAFTSVRANLPGAPTGFGAVVDYYGILPNLGLITLFTSILLFGVLYRRVTGSLSRPDEAIANSINHTCRETGDIHEMVPTAATPARNELLDHCFDQEHGGA